MKNHHSAVVAIIVAAACYGYSTNPSSAAENSPFVYFATSDPFLKPGQAPTKNDITVLGGPFVENAFGGALQIFGADYTSNYILGAAYGRDFHDLGSGFVLGAVGGVAVRFGEDDETSGEVWAGVRVRQQGLVIGDLVFSPAFTAGFSAVSGETEIESAEKPSGETAMRPFSVSSAPNFPCAGAALPMSN